VTDSSDAASRRNVLGSVDKALRILELLASAQDGAAIGLKAIANTLEMNKTSVHHSLATMRARSWVEQAPDGGYRLGPATHVFAQWWRSEDRLVAQLHPTLERISSQTNELVHLGRLTEQNVAYVDKVEPERPIRVWSQVGFVSPALTTAMGRAVLGARNTRPDALAAWVQATPNAHPALATRVKQEIERVHRDGYAMEIEENEAGIACVGIPLEVAGRVEYAVSVTVPVERFTDEAAHRFAAIVAAQIDAAALPGLRVARP